MNQQQDKPQLSSSRCLWKNPPSPPTAQKLNHGTASSAEAEGEKGLHEEEFLMERRRQETYDSILREFSNGTSTSTKTLTTLCCNTLVVGQEFALTCLFLARHRVIIWEEEEEQELAQQQNQQFSSSSSSLSLQQRVNQSQILSLIALVFIAIYTNSSSSPPQLQSRKVKVRQRTSDAILLAILLRIVASVLQTLTASYSTDTVERLAIGGMAIHWFTCDYSYANGICCQTKQQQQQQQQQSTTATTAATATSSTTKIPTSTPTSSKRPVFQGGTVSLNAAFFSTTLLASRLSSNATVYIFVSSAIILFAFFPASRHAISQHPKKVLVHTLVSLLLSLSTCCLLKDQWECICFGGILLTICVLAPLWKLWLQNYKRSISGPWDVVSVQEMKLYWTPPDNNNDDNNTKDR